MEEVNNVHDRGFIAVHVGAGQHSLRLKEKYQKLCREACRVAVRKLQMNYTALDAAVEAAIVLENSPLTNAGYGSNLTIEGKVECDASVMDGKVLQYGAVGAVSGIKNPVLLAKRLCQQQSAEIAHGRIPPSFLVGNGAHIWAREMRIQTLPPEHLISVKAQKIYKHYKRKIEECEVSQSHDRCMRRRMDTVGAICVDEFGNIASACSSGGIILKYPGRVGQAGVWGCGSWAYKDPQTGTAVGASTSGCGEHLVRTTLARTAAESLLHDPCPTMGLHRTMNADFIESRFLQGLDQRLGGVMAIRYSPHDGVGDFLWSHTTNSMIVGYMSSEDRSPVSRMSILPSHEVGKKAMVEGLCFKLKEEND